MIDKFVQRLEDEKRRVADGVMGMVTHVPTQVSYQMGIHAGLDRAKRLLLSDEREERAKDAGL